MIPTILTPELKLTCRKIFLRDLSLPVDIGVYDHEKNRKQQVVFNVDLYVDKKPVLADRLDEVVDYDFIRSTILELVSRGHFQLQETLCDEILHRLCAHSAVRAGCVSTKKIAAYPEDVGIGHEVCFLKPR